MSLGRFLKSPTFFINVFLALIALAIVIFGFLKYLSFFTKHGEEIKVPNLLKMKIEKAEETLEDLDLDYVVLDTIDFDKNFPPFSIVQQDPLEGEKVKSGRKIYLKINAGGYAIVTLPDFENKTYRQVQATMRALGLQEGEKEYKPYLAEDVVLEFSSNGKRLKAGDKILKNSVIDLIIGDGKKEFKLEEIESNDSIQAPIDENLPETESTNPVE